MKCKTCTPLPGTTRRYRARVLLTSVRAYLGSFALLAVLSASPSAKAALLEITAVDGETVAEASATTVIPFDGEEFDSDNASDAADSFDDFPLIVDAFANTSQAGADAEASLNASMSGNRLSADGGASASALAGEPNSARGVGSASISATFSLDRRLAYQLSWGFAVEGGSGGSITLRTPDAVIFSSDALGGIGGRVEVGVLDAGEYILSAGASAHADAPEFGFPGPAATTFGFDFTVVPEPASAPLAAMAATALGARVLRKGRRRRDALIGFVIR